MVEAVGFKESASDSAVGLEVGEKNSAIDGMIALEGPELGEVIFPLIYCISP